MSSSLVPGREGRLAISPTGASLPCLVTFSGRKFATNPRRATNLRGAFSRYRGVFLPHTEWHVNCQEEGRVGGAGPRERSLTMSPGFNDEAGPSGYRTLDYRCRSSKVILRETGGGS